GLAATAIYLEYDPTRRSEKVKFDTPLASPPPTSSTDAATPTPHHLPPTLKSTSQLLTPICSLQSQTASQNAHTKGSRPKESIRPIPHLFRNLLPEPPYPTITATIPDTL
ncbi:hypothetical protein L195_g061923, partial [Trifolium pratense]